MGSYARRIRQACKVRAWRPQRRNAYRCPVCGQHTITVEVDPGVTPATLGCRTTPGCPGRAVSLWYPDPWPADVPATPGWEWYRPDTAHMVLLRRQGGDLWDHLARGGLLIRRRGEQR